MTQVPDGLADWARKPGPAMVLDAVRTRARRGHRTESGTLSLSLSPEQRREVGLVLGTRWVVSGQQVNLRTLAARLAEHDLSVRQLVELLDGEPIEENRTLRERAEAAATAERAQAAATLTAADIPQSAVDLWLTDPGLPRPGDGTLAALAATVAMVWQRLPAAGEHVRLARLAADVLHDAHALDASEAAGRAVARLSAAVHGLERPQRSGTTWREAWAAIGVECDGVSSRVLILNLPLTGTRLPTAVLGEPLWLTLRALTSTWTTPARVAFVCENPTVVEAAADKLGRSCPPLICTDGIASGAAVELLTDLTTTGCQLNVRADIDPAGFTIVEQVLAVAPTAHLWRFDAATYCEALGTPPPEPSPTDTTEALIRLRDTYRTHQIPLHEERVLDTLLEDLTVSAQPGSWSGDRR